MDDLYRRDFQGIRRDRAAPCSQLHNKWRAGRQIKAAARTGSCPHYLSYRRKPVSMVQHASGFPMDPGLRRDDNQAVRGGVEETSRIITPEGLVRPPDRRASRPNSTVPAIKSRDLAGRFPIGHAFLQVSALIARQLSLGDAELGFQPTVFPMEIEHDQCATADCC